MRVLHLDAGREMRGGQWQVLRLVEGLAAAGVESTLLARQDAPLYVAARKQGWRVEPLGVTRALGCLRGHQLIHAHDARSHSLGAFLRARPLVVSRRVSFPVGSRWKYGRARRYLAVSQFVKKVLMQGGVPEEKISVVYDGVPVLEVSHGKQVLGLEKDSGLLAQMGLKMVANLEEEIPDAAILVYATNSEGLGSGALLAMSAAVPVIASNVGGLGEVIRHGENGLLVENDPAAIAGAIRQLLDHPEQARQIGAAARRTVIERFTVDRMVASTLEAYRRVLA
ncbi:MAG: glycosyltransferase family 4 protein [Candidatus Solibacter sp.]|nr:glycosyltransferase family 4 protein [Candidatus Solibacter sp.]